MGKVVIKRVSRRGKYYMELREGGKLVERRPWTNRPYLHPKKITKRLATENYKKNNSIYSDRKRFTGDTWKFTEEVRVAPTSAKRLEEKKGPRISKPRNLPYQYVIEGQVTKGSKVIEVTAASQQHDSDYPIPAAREEAIISFYERAHFLYMDRKQGYYDANEGRKLVEDGKVQVTRESIKVYRSK